MKRRSFLKNSGMAAGASLTFPAMASGQPGNSQKSIYELRVYHVARGGNNKNLILNYFRDAFIPVLSDKGVDVLLFDDYSKEEPVTVYALIAYPSANVYLETQSGLYSDPEYLDAAQSYNEILPASAPYTRYESWLMEGFDRWPSLVMPEANRNAFELRIYESSNEDFGRKKVEMFNNEEIDLFLETGLEPVFFGKILAGKYMPALIYMVALPDVASRDAAWEGFSRSEGWATMRVKPEYANVVSNIRRMFLTPIEL